ncbi:LemA family protein [Paratissierella segnis]|jgi:LemA protein|uniref:LemA family protein n=1 Tax=Paratissierella segnis TaxID=2763679 RepID=A0A926EV39_9FIRM|nr:LemA family protein [Paratissierella segnis]MBC8588186.1 LemA family protein [Paratissierella segnis]
MKGKSLTLIIIIIVIALVAITSIGTYNRLASMEESVDSAWAQVENVLKRRADLIPNLVNTVKGYASHEEQVLTQITNARAGFNSATSPQEFAAANDQLDAAIRSLNVVVENYPDLKANQNFLELQAELSGTENRISTERMRYNDAVRGFNTTIRRFPTNIVAKIFGYQSREYFEINPEDAEVPEVNF